MRPRMLFGVQSSGDGHMAHEFKPPLRVPPRAEVYVSTSVTAIGVDVTAIIDAVAVRDDSFGSRWASAIEDTS